MAVNRSADGSICCCRRAPETRSNPTLLPTGNTGIYGVLNVRVGRQIRRFARDVAWTTLFNTLYLDDLSYQRDPFRSTVRVREPGRNVYLNLAYRS